MIEATARILKNVIEIKVGDTTWDCRPVESVQEGIGRKIAALFSTEYHTYAPPERGVVHSTVTYHRKNDEIKIHVGGDSWRTVSSGPGPMTIEYRGVKYTINERLTGRFVVVRGTEPMAVGQLGFRSCRIDEYPPELEPFLANLALGYVIRTLAWEMFYSA
jgi:membrane protein implicated in regulation of membrane protease activity